jgi:hypothetical protein
MPYLKKEMNYEQYTKSLSTTSSLKQFARGKTKVLSGFSPNLCSSKMTSFKIKKLMSLI